MALKTVHVLGGSVLFGLAAAAIGIVVGKRLGLAGLDAVDEESLYQFLLEQNPELAEEPREEVLREFYSIGKKRQQEKDSKEAREKKEKEKEAERESERARIAEETKRKSASYMFAFNTYKNFLSQFARKDVMQKLCLTELSIQHGEEKLGKDGKRIEWFDAPKFVPTVDQKCIYKRAPGLRQNENFRFVNRLSKRELPGEEKTRKSPVKAENVISPFLLHKYKKKLSGEYPAGSGILLFLGSEDGKTYSVYMQKSIVAEKVEIDEKGRPYKTLETKPGDFIFVGSGYATATPACVAGRQAAANVENDRLGIKKWAPSGCEPKTLWKTMAEEAMILNRRLARDEDADEDDIVAVNESASRQVDQ